jgi:hypothetical protein
VARNAEAEAEAFAEEIEAEPRCSFCGGAGLDLVSSAAHVAYICWDCAAEAEALLRPRPPSPELQALGDAMFAHRAPEEPSKSPDRPKRQEARPPARQRELGGGAERHNGGGGRQ